jgi:hypothetical protein
MTGDARPERYTSRVKRKASPQTAPAGDEGTTVPRARMKLKTGVKAGPAGGGCASCLTPIG